MLPQIFQKIQWKGKIRIISLSFSYLTLEKVETKHEMSKLLWEKSLNIIFTERLSFLNAVQLKHSNLFLSKEFEWKVKIKSSSPCYCSCGQDVVGDWLGVSPAQGVEAGLRGRGLWPRRQQEVHHLPGELWLVDTADLWLVNLLQFWIQPEIAVFSRADLQLVRVLEGHEYGGQVRADIKEVATKQNTIVEYCETSLTPLILISAVRGHPRHRPRVLRQPRPDAADLEAGHLHRRPV